MIEKILAVAKRRGLTQAALERAAGLAENRISKWKDEIGEPTLRQVVRIAEVLEVPIGYLADDALDELEPHDELLPDEVLALDLYRNLRDAVGQRRAIRTMNEVQSVAKGTPEADSRAMRQQRMDHVALPPRPDLKLEPPATNQGAEASGGPFRRD